MHIRENRLAVEIVGMVAAGAACRSGSKGIGIHDKERDVEAGGVVQDVSDGYCDSLTSGAFRTDVEAARAEVLGLIFHDAPLLLSEVVELIQLSDEVVDLLGVPDLHLVCVRGPDAAGSGACSIGSPIVVSFPEVGYIEDAGCRRCGGGSDIVAGIEALNVPQVAFFLFNVIGGGGEV